MARATDLMGSGMPAAQAKRLGFTIASVTGVGTAQTSGPTLGQWSVNRLTTAGGATACTLPANAELGSTIEVYNISSTAGLVFPETGGQIDLGTATTGSVAIAQNRGRIFRKVADLQWVTIYGS